MNKLLTIHEAATFLGVSPQTLRRREKEGRGIPSKKTSGGQRRYDPAHLSPINKGHTCNESITLAYARVSSHDQKEDLVRQEKMLEMYCSAQGWKFEILSDLGSGMNDHKKGLKKLIRKILNNDIRRLVLTHKDRLLRFGAELIFSICEEKQIEVVLIINRGNENSFEEELAADVLEIITLFSARLYGSGSRKNKKLFDVLSIWTGGMNWTNWT